MSFEAHVVKMDNLTSSYGSLKLQNVQVYTGVTNLQQAILQLCVKLYTTFLEFCHKITLESLGLPCVPENQHVHVQ